MKAARAIAAAAIIVLVFAAAAGCHPANTTGPCRPDGTGGCTTAPP